MGSERVALVIGRPAYGESHAAVNATLLAAFGLPTVALAAVAYMAWAQHSSGGLVAVLAVWAFVGAIGWRWIRVDLRKAGRGLGSYAAGARAEAMTVRELESLPDGYVVFHGFRFADPDSLGGGWDLDHVVVGPTGVFAVATAVAGEAGRRPAHAERRERSAADLQDLLRKSAGAAGRLARVGALLADGRGPDDAQRASGGPTSVGVQALRGAIEGNVGEEGAARRLEPAEIRSMAAAVLGQYPEGARAAFAEELEALGT